MAIIKCKMCGGDMELSPDKSFGTCEYCGSTMTMPRVDDEQRAAAFNRGNHFRRIGEFDKALTVYERIVQEDETDAEAHWCCALCRFGIEYVKDPASGEYLPTCHRASFDSFLEDVDYKAALRYADSVARTQYEKDGTAIAEVQRGILAISQKEQPFDVFLCYKENDDAGNRTVDSTLAQEIYYELTEQGRRVFFARITLEDKAGQEYEPYIFAALHSAKVMVVVGTRPEYLNAVWVKNEWSRYLSLMKTDRKRLLIPCYRDMDPYDLPEQLSVLQAYDMGKIGFIQDLTRGIAKVLDAEKKSEPARAPGSGSVGGNAAALLRRAQIFLEDGEWNDANEYFDKVLDLLPECAEAYWGKTLASTRCATAEEYIRTQQKPPMDKTERLAACPMDGVRMKAIVQKYQVPLFLEADTLRKSLAAIDRGYDSVAASRKQALEEKERVLSQHKLFSRAVRYADAELAEKLRDVQEQILSFFRRRLEEAEQQDAENQKKTEAAYQAELDAMEKDMAENYADAQKTLSENYAKACADFDRHMQEKYETGIQLKALSDVFKALAGVFRALGPYKDSPEKARQCDEKAAALVQESKAADKAAKERKEREEAEAKAKARAKKRRTILISVAAVVVVAILTTLTVKVFIPAGKVSKAEKLIAKGDDQGAYDILTMMDPYGDSEALLADIATRAGYRATEIRSEPEDRDYDSDIRTWYNTDGNPSLVRHDYDALDLEDFDYIFTYTYYESGNPETCTVTRTDDSEEKMVVEFYDLPEAGFAYQPQGYLYVGMHNDIYGLQSAGSFGIHGARSVKRLVADAPKGEVKTYDESGMCTNGSGYTVTEGKNGAVEVSDRNQIWEYDRYGKITRYTYQGEGDPQVSTYDYEGDGRRPTNWTYTGSDDKIYDWEQYIYDQAGNLVTMYGDTDRAITWEWMVFADAEPAPMALNATMTLAEALEKTDGGRELEAVLGCDFQAESDFLASAQKKFDAATPEEADAFAEQVSSDLTLLMDSGDFDWMMDSLMERVEAESAQLICVYVSPDGVPLLRLTMDTTGWFRFDPVE